MTNNLRNYRILVVDADSDLANVLKAMLSEMGFVNVHLCKSGKEAINLLKSSKFDFLITEWNTQHIDGLELLKYLRRNPDSPNPAIPVIMLTGRAEIVDVFLARDYGINEYVVKPFTVRSIYNRLERIIEQPRSFVIAKSFIGPDRRAHSRPPEGVTERRVRKPVLVSNTNIAGETGEANVPRIFAPDFSLKSKLGSNLKLGDIITPSVLSQAQMAIEAITHDSLQWIRDNLRELKQLNETMQGDNPPATIVSDIADVALMINSRAGTFGYNRASEIAYALYLFARNKLDTKNKGHHIIVQKHIEVLHVILGNQMRGHAGEVGTQIASELRSLVEKYS